MLYKRGKPYIDPMNRTITKTTVLYLVFQKGGKPYMDPINRAVRYTCPIYNLSKGSKPCMDSIYRTVSNNCSIPCLSQTYAFTSSHLKSLSFFSYVSKPHSSGPSYFSLFKVVPLLGSEVAHQLKNKQKCDPSLMSSGFFSLK